MRGIALFAFVFSMLPVVTVKPFTGILLWTWLGLMNPHRLTWGPAFSFQFSMVVALVTISAWLISREPKRIPLTPLSGLIIAFVVWMSFTTLFALNPSAANDKWVTMIKIMIPTYIVLATATSRKRIDWLIWVIVISIGFYGFRGGLFTIMTGGRYLVWGPADSYIAANNAIAVAMLMVMPLMRYLQIQADKTWIKSGLLACIGLSAFSVLGTYSRGALLAGGVMVFFLAMKSRKRLLFVPALVLASVLALVFMPEQWYDRMATITSYEGDSSAIGRINAWKFAFRVAVDRPLTGGGFNVFWDWSAWSRYASDLVTPGLGAHSIFFEVLGEHGFIGFILALLIGLTAWHTCWRIKRMAARRPELFWARDLALMFQVSLVGFAAGGAFLNKALFDLYYVFLVLIVAIHVLVRAAVRAPQDAAQSEERLAEPPLAARISAPLRET